MSEKLFSLIGDIMVFAFNLPVDNFRVGQFGVRHLALLGLLLILLSKTFVMGLAVEVVRQLG